MKTENTPVGKVLRASESRRAAGMLNIGNIVAWVAAALVLIPWSVLDLRRIRREDWADIILPEPRTA